MKSKSKSIVFLLFSTFLGAAAQLLFKFSLSAHIVYILLFGILLYGISSLVYFYVVSRTNLSWAYGIGGMSYIFAVALAAMFLESVDFLRWVGVLVITIGVIMIALS